VPSVLQGAPGFWWAATTGLLLTALALSAFLARVMRQAHVSG
jgi:MATE family multidrug resistance protein